MVDDLLKSTLDYIYERIGIVELDKIYHAYIDDVDEELRHAEAELLMKRFKDVLVACEGNELYYYILSFILYSTNSLEIYKTFINACINDITLNKENRYNLYFYAMELSFLGVIKGDEESGAFLDALYKSILEDYKVCVGSKYDYIKKEKRNKDLIIVLTSQFLNLMHGPTKTTLDRSSVIKNVLKKNVVIINTAETSRINGSIQLFNQRHGSYIEEYSSLDEIEYNGNTFPFLQCPNTMPDSSVIDEIVDVIVEQKPYCIVCIGGSSIVNDICGRIIPTISISTVPSSRTQTYGRFQAIGRMVNRTDLEWLERNNLPRDHFIESIFTSSFKPQEHIYERGELHMPDDGFIVVLVGGRLDYEIDDGCMEMLLKLMGQGIYCAFMGVFNAFERWYEINDDFKKYAINLGFQEDALAVLECCDLYINPKRVGGGTSVAEALYKGVPVVTLEYGDGGLGAGTDFHVANYKEMYEQVLKYKSDKEYYVSMKKKAIGRASVLTDSVRAFVNIYETALERGL